jgi:N-acetylglucosamine kinase-like BadF-type ATPase
MALKYYIGIDGGGTKTALCAVNTGNQTLRYSKIAGTSWREHGALKVAQILKQAVQDLLEKDNEPIGGIAMGLSCFGESSEGDLVLEKEIRKAFSGIPIYFTNDVEVGWAGSMALEPGINIVAGTGAIAFGKDSNGKTARCGGWSEFFGDEGSCYWVGRKVMELFSKQSDGRIPRDELYETVRRELKLKDDFSFIDLIYNKYINYRKQVASLQLIAAKAALAGSPSAIELYKKAVRELLLLVISVRNQLNFSENKWNVSYSGGLFKAGDLVLPEFLREIENEGGKITTPRFKPVEGAVLLAFQHFAPESLSQIQEIIMESKT